MWTEMKIVFEILLGLEYGALDEIWCLGWNIVPGMKYGVCDEIPGQFICDLQGC